MERAQPAGLDTPAACADSADMHLDLTPLETRLLGCLLEKERTTPETYPLTLNSLTTAASQSTNRDPVMSVDPVEAERALEEMRSRKLVTQVMLAGSRAAKYRHELPDHYELQEPELALLCVLLLRGAQTPGELKTRTERLHAFGPDDLEACLQGLAGGDEPLVRQLAPQPGQKGRRWVQLLSGEPAPEFGVAEATPPPAAPRTSGRIDLLENRVAELETSLAATREEFLRFREQFGS